MAPVVPLNMESEPKRSGDSQRQFATRISTYSQAPPNMERGFVTRLSAYPQVFHGVRSSKTSGLLSYPLLGYQLLGIRASEQLSQESKFVSEPEPMPRSRRPGVRRTLSARWQSRPASCGGALRESMTVHPESSLLWFFEELNIEA